MANAEHVQRLKRNITGWNTWREKHSNVRPDLSLANLASANLASANLSFAKLLNANLSFANLTRADLIGARLSGTDLRGADLSDATLRRANLSGAYLMGTDLSGADLTRADLSGAFLKRTNLRWAIFSETSLIHIDFRETKGLAEIHHTGPSPTHLPTLQLPQDASAEHFLRGVGLPDEYIAVWRSTMMHPIQYHSVFISYSSRDKTLAYRLHADLQAHGVRCWFAPEDMKIGNKIRARIDEAIHEQDKLLLLLSEYSIASDWVEDEVEIAFDKERKQQREVLFPVRLDDAVTQTAQAWAAKLRRTRHIGDFTCWTDLLKYQNTFERLLRDLKHDGGS